MSSFISVMRYIAFFILLVPGALFARELPLWELGIGVGAISLPDYAGSDHRQSYVYPMPYVIYRGDILKSDEDGVRSELLTWGRHKFDISVNAGVPVNSDTDGVRSGMPDLDPTFEIGPRIEVRLNPGNPDYLWSLRLPIRAVVATDFSYTEGVGWVASPNLNFDVFNTGPGGGWKAGFSIGPMFVTEAYHDYYYEVDPEFATPQRPAYDARSGYAGMRFGAAASKRFDQFWVLLYARYRYLGGAVIDDSPLVETNHALLIGGGISWVFAESSQRVLVVE